MSEIDKQLRAVVIGAGLAGEGHTLALRNADVMVVAICSRTAEVVADVAARLRVPKGSTDWRATLQEERPDIVSVATPAAPHVEQITAALEMGCHVFSDKPLALTAGEAKQLYALARERQAKTAVATTWMYDPGVAYIAELVAAGAIGRPLLVKSDLLTPWPVPTPVTWINRLAEGGGVLNNRFPHNLSAVQRVVGGEVLAVTGQARVCYRHQPNVGHLHDYRQRMSVSAAEIATAEWEEVDGDDDCLVLVRLGQPGSRLEDAVVAEIHCSGVVRAKEDRTLTVYGERGSLHYSATPLFGDTADRPGLGISRADLAGGPWRDEPLPDRIYQRLPPFENDLQRDWASLAREFVADVRGEPHEPYPTFRNGWLNQEMIEAVRAGAGWSSPPLDLD